MNRKLVFLQVVLVTMLGCGGGGGGSSNDTDSGGSSGTNPGSGAISIRQGQSYSAFLNARNDQSIGLIGCPADIICILDKDFTRGDPPILSFFSTTASSVGSYTITIRVEKTTCVVLFGCITEFISENSYTLRITAAVSRFEFTPFEYSTGAGPTTVTLADINGDEILDIVTANRESHGLSDGSISIFLGSPAGDFGQESRIPLDSIPTNVVVADLNLDGIQDLAMGLVGYDHYAGVLIGRSDNRYDESVRYLLGERTDQRPLRMQVNDITGDGILDLIVAIQELDPDSGGAIVLAGLGDGIFETESQILSGGPTALNFDIGDSNVDGIDDLVFTNSVSPYQFVAENASSNMSVLPGDGVGGFMAGSHHAISEGSANTVLLTDLNRDALPDAVLSGQWVYVYYLQGEGNGDFMPAEFIKAGWQPDAIAAGDVDGDFEPDLMVANVGSHSVTAMIGDGVGGFEYIVSVPAGEQPTDIALADFNGDGALDFVVANFSTDRITVFMNAGGAGLQ